MAHTLEMNGADNEPWELYSRQQPRRGFRYPLQQSDIRAALKEAGVDAGHVGLWTGEDDPGLVAAAYWHSDPGSGYSRPNWMKRRENSTLLVVFAVPSTERLAAREALLRGPFAGLCAWVGRAIAAGNAWQASNHYRKLRWADGAITADEV